jgi:DNA-binding MarR family transcriptional regulator
MLTFEEDFKDAELFFPIINGKISFILKEYLQQKFNQSGLDITSGQWAILACLWEQDNVTQQALCDATFTDKPCMTRLIDALVEHGYIERKTSTFDRRSNIISLTDKGKNIQMPVNYAVFELIKDSLGNLTIYEIEMLRMLLKKIFKNLL